MAAFNAVLAVCAIPQMPHKHLPCKTNVFLQPLAVGIPIGVCTLHGSEFPLHIFENIGHRIGCHRTVAADVAAAGFYPELNRGNPRTILSAVMLFFQDRKSTRLNSSP